MDWLLIGVTYKISSVLGVTPHGHQLFVSSISRNFTDPVHMFFLYLLAFINTYELLLASNHGNGMNGKKKRVLV